MGCCCCKSSGEAKYTVTLAGCGRVNGVYVPHGSYGGRTMYTHETEHLDLWYNEGEWRIGATRDYYYINKSDDENPPMLGWEIADSYCNSDASRPVPNVTRKLCC